MNHILLIDPLEKLTIKKDTSLLLAATLQNLGHKTFVVFTKDLYFSNTEEILLKTYSFEAKLSHEAGYLESFTLKEELETKINSNSCLHFRVDPPFDTRYLRFLLILRGLKVKTGVKVINDPESLCFLNEKMIAYEYENALPSYVGSGETSFLSFCEEIKGLGYTNMVLKPLDLYQGIGVEKCSIENALNVFKRKIDELSGAIVAQPFMKEVEQGEKRAIYFAGKFIGAILKKPSTDDFLTNIAQGATFEKCSLTEKEEQACMGIIKQLDIDKVPWVAFDILGEVVQEANITCPGLLNEVSNAHNKNLAEQIVELVSSRPW